MRIASLQMAVGDDGRAAALDRALMLIDRAADCDLALLPEMWTCGYFSFDRYAAEAESITGPTITALAAKAREHKLWLLAGSIPERVGDQLFNTAVLLNSSGELVGEYRKVHLFGYQSEEPQRLMPGNDVAVLSTPWGNVGVAICYDLRFPELFRAMIDRGAEMFLVPSAWPASRVESWTLFNRARAAENLAFLISCNAAGTHRGQTLGGHSLVVGPFGQPLASAGASEEVLIADIDPADVARARADFPALRDRRRW